MSGSQSHVKVHSADVARTRVWTVAASAGLCWGLFTLVILHVVSSFNPLTDPLSRYAFTDQGGGMLEASLLSVAVGVIAVRGAVLSSGLPVTRTTSTLVYATSTGLATAALFRATFSPEIDPISGRIHQYASVVAFASLPAIALSLLDAIRATPALRRTAVVLTRLLRVALISLALFGLSYVADALATRPVFGTLGDVIPVGFTQRIVFVVDFSLLTALLVAAMRCARSSDPHSSASAPQQATYAYATSGTSTTPTSTTGSTSAVSTHTASTPAASAPAVSTPPASTPAVSAPAVSAPAVSASAVSTHPASAPAASAHLASAQPAATSQVASPVSAQSAPTHETR